MEPDQLLSRALARKGLKAQFASVSFAAPTLPRIAAAFASWIDELVPDAESGGAPLLDTCLATAIDAFESAPPEELGSTEQMRRFVIGLLRHVHRLNRVTIVSGKGRKAVGWDPLRDGPLALWAERVGRSGIRAVASPLTTVSDAAIRQVLMARILTLAEVEWMEGVSGHPADNATPERLYAVLAGAA